MEELSSGREYLTSSHGITGAGYMQIILLLFSAFISYMVINRAKKKNKVPSNLLKVGCVGYGYVFLVVSCLTTLGFGAFSMLGKSVINIISLPKYQAKIIDYSAHMSSSSGHRTVRMYSPVVEFIDKEGRLVKSETDLSSSAPPEIGSYITVGYDVHSDQLSTMSWTKYFMLLGLATMAFILLYFLVLGICYSFGIKNGKWIKMGIGFLMYYLFPAGMLLLLYGCGYQGVYRYIKGERADMPIWALLICGFFSIVLFFSLIGYVKMLIGKKEKLL